MNTQSSLNVTVHLSEEIRLGDLKCQVPLGPAFLPPFMPLGAMPQHNRALDYGSRREKTVRVKTQNTVFCHSNFGKGRNL